jgi:exodeoxyribonuclease VII small subunit
MSQKKQSFEDSLSDLEKIVGKLERGDLALEDSLELFEKGVKLSRECQERLNQAERRIEVLIKGRNGESILEDLEGREVESVEVESVEVETEIQIYKKITFNDDEDDDNIPF